MTFHHRHSSRSGVPMVADDAPGTGWITLDLDRTFPAVAGTVPARFGVVQTGPWSLRGIGSPWDIPGAISVASPGRGGWARRVSRIPSTAIVPVGRRLLSPVVARSVPASLANDNPPPGPAAARARGSVARQMFFLAVLLATIAGAYLNGRQHGFRRVIMVPDPLSWNVSIG